MSCAGSPHPRGFLKFNLTIPFSYVFSLEDRVDTKSANKVSSIGLTFN